VANDPTIPRRFSVIDETNRDQYAFLQPHDECYYIWERMSQLWSGHEEPDYSRIPATNTFIANFQIPVTCKTDHPKRYYWKEQAIKYAATALGQLLPENWRDHGSFVPVPPSKVKDDAEHDPRLLDTLRATRPRLNDIRELVLQYENVDAKRKGVNPANRAENYTINEDVADPAPDAIFIFDDVLTTGCHFKAVEIILKHRYPATPVFGLFLARAVRPRQDDDEDVVAFL
jgi:hypothetical protein